MRDPDRARKRVADAIRARQSLNGRGGPHPEELGGPPAFLSGERLGGLRDYDLTEADHALGAENIGSSDTGEN
jgi:hypothetical protein